MSKRTRPCPAPGGPDRDRGSALVVAVFVIALLTSLGLALLFLTRLEVRSSRADGFAKQAFYLAEGGLEDGRASLFLANGKGDFTDDLIEAAGYNLAFDFDPDAVLPAYDAGGDFIGFTGYGDDDLLSAVTHFGDGWYASFLSNDADEPGTTVDLNDRVVITGVGVLENRSMEVVQALVRKRELIPVMPPATVTLLGPAPAFESSTSRVKDYSGNDCAGEGIPDLYVPVVGTIGSSAETLAEAGMHSNPDFVSGGYTDEEVFADLTDPGEPTLSEIVDPSWTDCGSVWDLVEDIREAADTVCVGNVTCSGGGSCPCDPDLTAPGSVTFVDGDYVITGNKAGHGLLVVTGRLEFSGNTSWNGLILVLGQGSYNLNGGGNGAVSGGIVVADIAGPDGSYGSTCSGSGERCWNAANCPAGESCSDSGDNCTGGDGGFGSVDFNENGGGGSTIVYCTVDLDASNPPRPYEILSFRQR